MAVICRHLKKTSIKLTQLLHSVGVSDIDIKEKLIWLSKRTPRNKLNIEEKESLLTMVKKMRSFSGSFEAGFERKKYELYVRLIEQYVNYNTSNKANLLREEYIAENCLAIIDLEGGAKAIISSHNGHIARARGPRARTPMGNFLIKKLGNTYYSLATGFASGSFKAVDMKKQEKAIIHFDAPPKKSHDLLFSKCTYPNFFMDFRSLQVGELKNELSKTQESWNLGAGYYSEKRSVMHHNLLNSYDGILFVRKTSPPNKLSWDLIDR